MPTNTRAPPSQDPDSAKPAPNSCSPATEADSAPASAATASAPSAAAATASAAAAAAPATEEAKEDADGVLVEPEEGAEQLGLDIFAAWPDCEDVDDDFDDVGL